MQLMQFALAGEQKGMAQRSGNRIRPILVFIILRALLAHRWSFTGGGLPRNLTCPLLDGHARFSSKISLTERGQICPQIPEDDLDGLAWLFVLLAGNSNRTRRNLASTQHCGGRHLCLPVSAASSRVIPFSMAGCQAMRLPANAAPRSRNLRETNCRGQLPVDPTSAPSRLMVQP